MAIGITTLTFFGLLISQPTLAQVYQSIAPPAPVLPDRVNDYDVMVGQFDAFAPDSYDKARPRLWQTFNIRPGSWGDPRMWDSIQQNSTTIKRFRNSFIQNVELSGGFVNRNGQDDLGYSWADAGITMVVPLGSTDNLLVFSPRYQADWNDGPVGVDVPSYLQAALIDIGWRRKFNCQWSVIAGVQPGYFNDRYADAKGFRMGGLVMLNYQTIPDQLTFSFGIVYLDQNDYQFIPGIGMTWIPNPNTRFDLNFPKPKISRRISHIPYILEDWVYVAGSFGGGTWAVRRTNGTDDELNLRDFRVSIGFERILDGGTGLHVDLGYVFGRKLEYLSDGVTVEFGNSFLIETGLRF